MSTEAAAVRAAIPEVPRPLPLRLILSVHLLLVFAQAVFAGQFLSGSDGAVLFHEVNGWTLAGICLVQIVLSFVLKRIPLWFAIVTVFVFLCEGLQIGTGYGRFLAVHVPLGILTFGLVVWQAVWAFWR
jgi:hypothetical protein